ncbi:MAG: sigma-54-dependent Fis family transcriptional regulator [Planctomycetaceae bacterium]|nr:sigma-54-dependent Fis family transcriptional regulator [Planctomycetaceae bacterium]
MPHTLLLIDDETGIRFTIQEILTRDDVRVLTAANARDGLQLVREESPDVILLDIRLEGQSGLDVFHEIKQINPRSLVIFITGHGTTDTAIEAMKLGAFDYLVKPLDFNQLQQVVEQAFKISWLMNVPTTVDSAEGTPETSDRLIGTGPAMQSICKQIGRIAPQDVNVLILGESGTGKELVARAIYQHSRRNQAPFLAINCAAIPENLLESELFGHERGAFTGAERQRVGKFEQCHKGTIFLDEVGDMPQSTQAKILRLLQEGQFERVGGNETLSVDVRVVAATNQNLDTMIDQGKFRRDLYYRLRGVTLSLPALRDRIEDIPELAHYFLFRFNRQLGTSVQSISMETLDRLQRYRWPGNVRQLQSVIREALITSTGTTLLPEFLPSELHQDEPETTVSAADLSLLGDTTWQGIAEYVERDFQEKSPGLYRRALQQFDGLIVGRAMQLSEGNQLRASEILGISRPTLRSKLRAIKAQRPSP